MANKKAQTEQKAPEEKKQEEQKVQLKTEQKTPVVEIKAEAKAENKKVLNPKSLIPEIKK